MNSVYRAILWTNNWQASQKTEEMGKEASGEKNLELVMNLYVGKGGPYVWCLWTTMWVQRCPPNAGRFDVLIWEKAHSSPWKWKATAVDQSLLCKEAQTAISNTVTKPDWGAKRWNPGKGKEIEEDAMVIDGQMEKNPYVIPRLTWRKAKALQQHLPPQGQPPIQETFMMREYTPTKLTDWFSCQVLVKGQGKYPGMAS